MSAKTFILGIGAPKAGTTWFYHYLKSFSQVDLGFKKEYHVFDVANIENCRFYAGSQISRETLKLTEFAKKSNRIQKTLSEFRENHELYFDYFSSLLGDNTTITADITPTYLKLPSSVLGKIRKGFESRNVQVKVVVFLRDPVDRMISVAKMGKRFGEIGGVKVDKTAGLDEILENLIANSFIVGDGQYRDVLSVLRTCYSEENIYIGLYETMFEDLEIQRLSSFLDVKPNFELAHVKHNQSHSTEEKMISPGLISKIRKIYEEEYEFFRQEYPELSRRNIWHYCDGKYPNMR